MRTPVWQVSLLIIDFIFISYFRERPRYPSESRCGNGMRQALQALVGKAKHGIGVLVDWTVELQSSILCESLRT